MNDSDVRIYERWMLCADDAEALEDVREELWEWIEICETGSDLIGLGSVVDAIDSILEDGTPPTAAVQISISNVKISDSDGKEVDFELGDIGIKLGSTVYIGTGQGTSRDHHCEALAHLTERGRFSASRIEEWITQAQDVRRGLSLSMSTDIVALPDF